MAEEDEWTREEWEAYVRTQYKTLLAAKFADSAEAHRLSIGAMSTVATESGNARDTYWCICDYPSGVYSIKDNYINDVRYSLVGSSVRREAAILEVPSADSTDDTVVIEYEISGLQINPSADYNGKQVQVIYDDEAMDTGVTYGTYAPCTYLKTNYPGDCNMSAEVEMPFCNASGLRESLCSSHYAAYVFPSTEPDGSIVIDTHPQFVRYSATNTYDVNKAYIVIGNPSVPEDPDDPDVPVDPEDPIPSVEYSEISYLSLSADQVVLTDAYIVPGTTEVSCSFGIDFEGESPYSLALTYPIISCPVGYGWSACGGNVDTYSTPSSIDVSLEYSDYSMEANGILGITRPEGCSPIGYQSTQYSGLAVQGDHTLRIALLSEADSSAVYLDSYSQVLPGIIIDSGSEPIAIGGCGYCNGDQCHGVRKIYSAEVKGYAVVELQPVMTSDGREGLLNKTTGNIFYPMASTDFDTGYAMDYIILNSNIGIAITAQVKYGSRIAVTFNVPGNELGYVPIMSIPGRVYGDEFKVHVWVRTRNTDSGIVRGLEVTVYNESTSTGQLIINHPVDVDDSMHNLVVDFSSGSVIIDDVVISNSSAEQELTALNWEQPADNTYRILIGESSIASSSGFNYLGVKLVEVRNAYGIDISTDTGLVDEFDVKYYLPVLNSKYVACLTQANSADGFTYLDPLYAVYSMPGYCRIDAGLYRLPGDS